MSAENSNTYRVEGMSCGHCEAAVRDEVEKVDGVETTDIDLASKQVVVRGKFEDATVRAAIAAAGYEAA
ncbi:MAG: cation transporter [Acidimicrobiia bacterium]|nr:cation transporter [Acidimicrobiia bacterium]